MDNLLSRIVEYKKSQLDTLEVYETRTRDVHKLKDYMDGDAINVIAEIKSSSPSAGRIRDINLREIVPVYKHYASAISVLTDDRFFMGSFERLKEVADMVDMPILCKDFIIDEAQINKAFACGADIILLIVRIVDKERLRVLYDYAAGLGLDVLVEIHNEDELDIALNMDSKIVGVNSRDLDTLNISLTRAVELLKIAGGNVVKIAESGIKTKEDIDFLRDYCNGFLIGERLLKGDIDNNFKALGIVKKVSYEG